MNQPLTKGGSNYHSERLVVRGNLILVKPTKRHLFCMSLFGIVGLFFAVFPCLLEQRLIWPGVIFGGVFFLLGCSIFISEIRKPHPLINLSLRQLYPHGMKHPSLSVPLNSFSQLEIVAKDIYNPKGQGYPCYELNAVLNDGSRYILLNHGNLKRLREDARLLADILNLQIQEENLSPQVPSPQQASLTVRGFQLIIMLLFSLLFLAVGCLVLWGVCLKPLHVWNTSRHWTPTPAIIVHSALAESKTHALYRIDIRYDYEFDGVSHQGTRYDFFSSDNYSNQSSSMLNTVDDNPVGKKTTCLVNPKHPEEAVLSRAIPYSRIPWFLFPLPFIFFGLFIPFLAIKTLCSPRQQP